MFPSLMGRDNNFREMIPAHSIYRPPADHPFHFSQLFIILNRTDYLLDVFAGGIQNGTYQQGTFACADFCVQFPPVY